MPTLYDNFSQVRQYIDENNTSYVTKTELANASYASTSYVADYVAEHGGGSTVIDENIIPKENNTYSLGSSSYKYNKVWATNLYGQLSGNISNASQLAIDLGGSTIYRLYADKIVPNTTNSVSLGDSTYLYAATYTNDLYYSGKISYISDKTKLIMNDRNIDIYANNKKLVNVSDYDGVVPMQSDVNLGSSSSVWANTYTENLYSPSLVLSYSYNSIDNASNTQINFKVNQWNRMKLTNTALMPSTNNGIRLGDSGAQWSSTYVRDLYLNGTNIEDRFTYLVWTGTSAEYEALSDYTTYQFYLIQES